MNLSLFHSLFFQFGLEAFYNNRGDRVKFANLFEELAEGVPKEKIEKMKSLIQSKARLILFYLVGLKSLVGMYYSITCILL